jgi:hypothetical protein
LEILLFAGVLGYLGTSLGTRLPSSKSLPTSWRIALAVALLAILGRIGYMPEGRLLSVSFGLEVLVIMSVAFAATLLFVRLISRAAERS